MTKPRSINLKNITLVPFLLFYVLAPFKNIATSSDNVDTEQSNDDTSYIKTVTEKILGELGYLCGFRGNIIDWICTSTYNYYTDHNLRKTGWYHGRFYIYGGIKIKITKNLFLDVYYSFLKLIPFYIIDVNIYGGYMYILTLFAFITISINIRIYKNFYLSIAPMSWIGYKILDFLVRYSHPPETEPRR